MMPADYWFDGDIWAQPSLMDDIFDGEKGDGVKAGHSGYPESLREYLYQLALQNGGLGAIQVFETWRGNRFVCFANSTRAEMARILEQNVNLNNELNELEKTKRNGLYTLTAPHSAFCLNEECALVEGRSDQRSGMDEIREMLVYPGSGFPTNEEVRAVLEKAKG